MLPSTLMVLDFAASPTPSATPIVEYGLHALRLTRQHDPRLRYAMERIKEAIDTLWDRLGTAEDDIDTIEAGSSVDYASFAVNGTTSEDIAAPTSGGDILVRCSTAVTSAGTHTLNFLTRNALFPVGGGGTTDVLNTSGAGSMLFAVGVEYDDGSTNGLRWNLMESSGWSVI